MRCETILNGFPLRINISFLAIAIVCAATSSLSDRETLRMTFLAVAWLLTLLAVGPSSFGFVWEDVRKGKPRSVDPNTVIPEWQKFCQSMGIKESIKVKVFPNLRNAYARHTTIGIGQPVLDSLDSVSIKAVFAHELTHIKRNHTLKRGRLLLGVIFVPGVLLGVLYSIYPSGSSIVTYAASSIIIIDFVGIAARFISWPFEYEADLIADQCVKHGAVAASLKGIATLRKMDVTRDFYWHPSINKRIANLDWSQKTRFKKWYIEL
jgi:Zn-dependent protease with chaperone function